MNDSDGGRTAVQLSERHHYIMLRYIVLECFPKFYCDKSYGVIRLIIQANVCYSIYLVVLVFRGNRTTRLRMSGWHALGQIFAAGGGGGEAGGGGREAGAGGRVAGGATGTPALVSPFQNWGVQGAGGGTAT